MRPRNIEAHQLLRNLTAEDSALILTENGEPSAVLMSATSFNKLLEDNRTFESQVKELQLKIEELEMKLNPPAPDPEEEKRKTRRSQSLPEAARFLATCPEALHEPFDAFFRGASQAGMKTRWGKRGPSLRAVRPDESQCTLFYVFAPGAQGSEHASCEVYLGNINDEVLREEARARFMEVGPFEAQGSYTLRLSLEAGPGNLPGIAGVLLDISARVAGGVG